VLISDEELKVLQVESSKAIDVTRFVDREEVDPVCRHSVLRLSR